MMNVSPRVVPPIGDRTKISVTGHNPIPFSNRIGAKKSRMLMRGCLRG